MHIPSLTSGLFDLRDRAAETQRAGGVIGGSDLARLVAALGALALRAAAVESRVNTSAPPPRRGAPLRVIEGGMDDRLRRAGF